MKKTDYGIKLDSMHDIGFFNEHTYCAYFDLADDVDDLGRPMKCSLEVDFNKSKNTLTFLRFTEDVDGDSEIENVEKKLNRKTIQQICDKMSNDLGIKFVI